MGVYAAERPRVAGDFFLIFFQKNPKKSSKKIQKKKPAAPKCGGAVGVCAAERARVAASLLSASDFFPLQKKFFDSLVPPQNECAKGVFLNGICAALQVHSGRGDGMHIYSKHTHSLSLSLSLSHTHTHTHTHLLRCNCIVVAERL
jgi:hypothetical protein